MKVLAMNCGSSTLKFQVIELVDSDRGDEASQSSIMRLAHGLVDRIGGQAAIEFTAGGERFSRQEDVGDHAHATRLAFGWLDTVKGLESASLDTVGHRVVHGGPDFVDATLLDDDVVNAIDAIGELAPLHNAPAVSAIRAAREILGPEVPMIASFDTAFHRTLPDHAGQYAIPFELATRHRIRRYGFHGLAHRHMLEQYVATTGGGRDTARIITLQLGNGCSAAAIAGGQSIDTTMGFTPLEGLMMGTRSGDIDPALVGFLSRQEGVEVSVVEGWLNSKSGLLGVSGVGRDMREILAAASQGNPRASLAVEMFCYRVRKTIGSYLAAMGGASAIVFGGGIGENAPDVRARICSDFAFVGLELDEARNARTVGTASQITTDDSRLHAFVFPVDEAIIIARDAARIALSQKSDSE
jgi:acetate kinase